MGEPSLDGVEFLFAGSFDSGGFGPRAVAAVVVFDLFGGV